MFGFRPCDYLMSHTTQAFLGSVLTVRLSSGCRLLLCQRCSFLFPVKTPKTQDMSYSPPTFLCFVTLFVSGPIWDDINFTRVVSISLARLARLVAEKHRGLTALIQPSRQGATTYVPSYRAHVNSVAFDSTEDCIGLDGSPRCSLRLR